MGHIDILRCLELYDSLPPMSLVDENASVFYMSFVAELVSVNKS